MEFLFFMMESFFDGFWNWHKREGKLIHYGRSFFYCLLMENFGWPGVLILELVNFEYKLLNSEAFYKVKFIILFKTF